MLLVSAQSSTTACAPIYLPYAALPLDELCAWALSLLGFSQSDDTIGDLIQTATHLLARGSGLLLLIDDASAMPLPTARKLGDLVAASRGSLRLLVAAAEGPSASRMLAATGANVHVVRLVEAMSEEETRRYVAARLARARVPRRDARFDATTLQSIHRLSAGIPRRVHSVASAVLRGGKPARVAPIRSRARSDSAERRRRDAPPVFPPSGGPVPRIEPTVRALRTIVARRPIEPRVEAAPSARAVFATVLAVRRARPRRRPLRALALAPPISERRTSRSAEPAPVPAPSAAEPPGRRSRAPTAVADAAAPTPDEPAPAAHARGAGQRAPVGEHRSRWRRPGPDADRRDSAARRPAPLPRAHARRPRARARRRRHRGEPLHRLRVGPGRAASPTSGRAKAQSYLCRRTGRSAAW